MKKGIKRAICSAAAFTILFTSIAAITSCGKKKEQSGKIEPIKEITADMPWYDTTTVLADGDINKDDYYLLNNSILGYSNGNILVSIYGNKILPPEVLDEYPGLTHPNITSLLRIYDTNGNLIDDVDLEKKIIKYSRALIGEEYDEENDTVITDSNDAGQYDPSLDLGDIYPEARAPKLVDGMIRIQGYASAPNCLMNFYYDPVSREVVSHEAAADEDEMFFPLEDRMVEFEGYSVDPAWDSMNNNYLFAITSPDGNTVTLSASQELPEIGEINIISNYIYLGDGKVLVYVVTQDFEDKKFIIDLRGGQMQSLNGDTSYDWLDDLEIWNAQYFEGIGNIYTNDYGLNLVDLEGKTSTLYLSYNNCNINMYDLYFLSPIYMDEQMIIMTGMVYRGSGEILTSDQALQEFVILKKAGTNPNAGKQVLNAAFVDGMIYYPMAEAIRLFNEQSSDAIILMDPRYTAEALADQISSSDDESYDEYSRKLTSALVTALSVDLMSGDGPDLLFGGIQNSQLNRPELLTDLSSRVDRNSCYGNIIDSAMTGDALYQIPLAFELTGLLVGSDSYPADTAGLTFEQYRDFVYNECNGTEPTKMSRVGFLNMCLRQMNDVFCINGTYDYNRDEFRQIAEFTSEMIPPDITGDEIDDSVYFNEDIPVNTYQNINSIRTLIEKTRGMVSDYRLLGTPSFDARGPMATVLESVAVSATTTHPESCLAFVDLLLTSEYQLEFARNSGLSINRDANEENIRDIVEGINYKYENYYSLYYTPTQMYDQCVPAEIIDADTIISTVERYIDSSSGIGYIDAPVQIIVSEEVQAYFAGQKTLNDILDIINNRVATYVNERQT